MSESHTAVHGRLSRIEYRRTKGQARRRRDKSISDKLKQVHTPWYKRKTPNSVHIPGTVLFDLEQDKKPMKKTRHEGNEGTVAFWIFMKALYKDEG